MTGTPERLQFAVRFATMDLDAARPGDWSNLRDDLTDFFGPSQPTLKPALRKLHKLGKETAPDAWPPGGWITDVLPPASEMTDGELRTLQRDTRQLLEYVSDRHAKRTGSQKIGPSFQIASHKTPCYVTGGAIAYKITGKPHPLFLDLLFTLLSKAGSVSPVLRCPECDGLFYRIRKQRYCSRQCVSRANWRDYMKTADGKTAKRKSDRKRREAAARKKNPTTARRRGGSGTLQANAKTARKARKGVKPKP